MNSSYRLEFNSFSITVRELLISIIILVVFLLVGIGISSLIKSSALEEEEKYLKAYKLNNDNDMWNYITDTEIGSVLAAGTACIIDGVTMDGIEGNYWSMRKEIQKYTKHTEEVRHEREVGDRTEVYYTTETYWSWDTIDTHTITGTKFDFLGKEYNVGDFGIGNAKYYLTTTDAGYHLRYVYYVTPAAISGVLYTEILHGQYNHSIWYANSSIDNVLNQKSADFILFDIIFWIIWIFFLCIVIVIYLYKDNEYLED